MVIRGKYEILDKIGAGGMAWVYRARHLAFDEIRAIKILRSWMADDEDFIRRLKSEAVIARRLRHPNAVLVDDLDQMEDGRPFIVMEYVEGPDIRSIVHGSGPMPVWRVLSIAAQVLSALSAAHRLGIVHRDIKPDNILLVPQADGSDVVKVLDFGIAKLREAKSNGTKTGFIICTPEYASPEQARASKEMDGRSDLYSLGVVMYEMLTGALPFHSDSQFGMLLHHINSTPVPPAEKYPDLGIPPELSELIMVALEKDSARRFQNADAMLKAVKQISSNYEPQFSPPVEEMRQVIPIDTRRRQSIKAQPQPEPEIAAPVEQQYAAAPVEPEPEYAASDLLLDDEPEPKSWAWLWAVAVIVVVITAAGAAYGPALIRNYTSSKTSHEAQQENQQTSGSANDDDVRRRVESALMAVRNRGAQVTVAVNHGAITLSGSAPTQEIALEARRDAQNATGLAVSSDIQVAAAPTPAIPDHHIEEDVGRELSGPQFQQANISVSVHNGTVILTGQAPQQGTVADAVAAAARVPGVVNVRNSIQVKSPAVAITLPPVARTGDVSTAPVEPAKKSSATRSESATGSTDRQVQRLIARARQLNQKERYDDALATLDKALQLDPDNQDAQDLMNQTEDAKRWVEENLGKPPDQ